MSDACTFRAIVPSIGTAIKIHGDGGWRVQFDIPASDEGAALELLTMRGVVLEVTVRPETKSDDGATKSSKIKF